MNERKHTEQSGRPGLLALILLSGLILVGLAGFGLAMGIVVVHLMEVVR